MSSNEIKFIQKNTLEKYIAKYYHNQRMIFLTFLIAFLLFLVFAIAVYCETGNSYLFPLPALFLILGIYALFKSNLLFKKNKYCIIKDSVVQKRQIEAYESSNILSYIIYFENHGEHKLLASLYPDLSPHKIYEKTLIGDTFYLVVLNENKKPHFVFPEYEWEIDRNEFEEKEGKFLPI